MAFDRPDENQCASRRGQLARYQTAEAAYRQFEGPNGLEFPGELLIGVGMT